MKIIRQLGYTISIITILLLISYSIYAQSPAPVVSNFNRNDYLWTSQNWAVCSTNDGMIHFANNSGLLSFDGTRWQRTECAQMRGMRSLLNSAEDRRLYCGGYEEFGYWKMDRYGYSTYVSLSDRLENWEMKNDQIWSIFKIGGCIYFHSFVTAFIYDTQKDSVRGLKLDSFCENAGKSFDGSIYTSAALMSRLDLESGVNTAVEDIPFNSMMVASIPADGFDWIVTLSDGIWKYDGKNFTRFSNEADELLESCNVNRAYGFEGDIIIGSILRGCMRISPEGRLKWHVEAPKNLQNSTVLGIGSDMDRNIWLALDSGVSCVSADNGFSCIKSIEPPVGAIYAIKYDLPYIYMGTNKGLYVAEQGKDGGLVNIRKDDTVEGHVWNISTFDGQIICGSNGGSYELKDGKVLRTLCDVDGCSCIARGSIHGKEVLVQGTYTKLCIYEKRGGQWCFRNMVDGFIEPIEEIDVDFKGLIWAGHEQKGLYKIELSKDLEKVNEVEYFPALAKDRESEKISVNRIIGRTVFSNGESSWTYDDMNDRIIPYKSLNKALGRFAGSRRAYRHDDDRFWLIRDGENALVDFTRPDSVEVVFSISDRSFGSLGVDDREQISLSGDGKAVFTLDNALGILDLSKVIPDTTRHKLRIRGVELRDINGHSCGRQDLLDRKPVFSYNHRLITVDFVCPRFDSFSDTRYMYMLEGRDNVWTDLGEHEQVAINYLKAGNYTLKIKAVSSSEEILDSLEYNFRVRPPFYSTIVAKIFYIISIIALIVLIIIMIFRRSRRKAEELERKNLEDEIKAKSKLIASNTMSLIRKNEILTSIKDELREQKKELGDAYPDRYYRKMISAIDDQISTEEDWKIFQHNFDRIHGGFFHILKERYPELTTTDLRFCSLLCQNMSSKEIATMMNISLKGVEAARYRIRKKMNLDSGVSLTEFLINLE